MRNILSDLKNADNNKTNEITVNSTKKQLNYNVVSSSPLNNDYKPIIYYQKSKMYSPSDSPIQQYKKLVLPKIVKTRKSEFLNGNEVNVEALSSNETSSNVITNNLSINYDSEIKNKKRILSSIPKALLQKLPNLKNKITLNASKVDNFDLKPNSIMRMKVIPRSALPRNVKPRYDNVYVSIVSDKWKI